MLWCTSILGIRVSFTTFHVVLFDDLQGEEEDREDDWYNDEEYSRTRRQKAQKIQATVPVIYNNNQHNI